MAFQLLGTMKKPVDIMVENRWLRQVTRIIGNDEYGFLFYYSQHGKRIRTAEPLWHIGHEKHKRNDMPRLSSIQQVRYIVGDVIVNRYDGFGYYTVTDREGHRYCVHMHAFK